MSRIIALVDVNSMYTSCETLFRPDLQGRPVVVASNNDGCVVARSAEAKAIGIQMGEPLHKLRDKLREHGVVVFSSNYALYGDLSARTMMTLESLAPDVEVYSIDEAFLDLTGTERSEPWRRIAAGSSSWFTVTLACRFVSARRLPRHSPSWRTERPKSIPKPPAL